VHAFLAGYHGLAREALEPHLYQLADVDAARHLFKVAGGLGSMVMGDRQILGQVRNALTTATRKGPSALPPVLTRLFHGALTAGRRIQEETALGRSGDTVGHTAVRLAQRTLGSLKDQHALVIGAGAVAANAAKSLAAAGVRDLVIANRTPARGRALARLLGGRAIGLDRLPQALADASLVISATGSPGLIITKDMLAAVLKGLNRRPGCNLLLIDLAVPRDIDPAAAALDGVLLLDIDQLPGAAHVGAYGRERAASQAGKIVEEELIRFAGWLGSLKVAPRIKEIGQRAEAIRRQELERSLKKMPGLAPQQQQQVDALTRSLVKKLLHDSIVDLKTSSAEERTQTAAEARAWEARAAA
ncbi:MAG: glutamyl-tRNA reductase, partial [Chloroflexi bacterium]|nr:glutamyl-tRNA reductase [Chloroflexota bacterium]